MSFHSEATFHWKKTEQDVVQCLWTGANTSLLLTSRISSLRSVPIGQALRGDREKCSSHIDEGKHEQRCCTLPVSKAADGDDVSPRKCSFRSFPSSFLSILISATRAPFLQLPALLGDSLPVSITRAQAKGVDSCWRKLLEKILLYRGTFRTRLRLFVLKISRVTRKGWQACVDGRRISAQIRRW